MEPFSRFANYFLVVAQSGSFRKAAEVLHVSGSAIHRQIQLAEEMMETPLFERLPNGLRMTAAGELLYHDLKRWQKEFRLTRQRFHELQGLKRGHVSVGLIAALSAGPIANALAEICLQYPQITFDIRTMDSYRMQQLIVEGDVDFGFMLDPSSGKDLDIRAFQEIPIGVVLAPEHPLANETSLTFSQIYEYRQLLPAAPLIVHERTQALYHKHQIPEPLSLVCNDVHLMKTLIRKNVGLGLLGWLDVCQEVSEGVLRFIPLRDASLKPLTLALCVAPSRQLSRAAQQVIQLLTETMEQSLLRDETTVSLEK